MVNHILRKNNKEFLRSMLPAAIFAVFIIIAIIVTSVWQHSLYLESLNQEGCKNLISEFPFNDYEFVPEVRLIIEGNLEDSICFIKINKALEPGNTNYTKVHIEVSRLNEAKNILNISHQQNKSFLEYKGRYQINAKFESTNLVSEYDRKNFLIALAGHIDDKNIFTNWTYNLPWNN